MSAGFFLAANRDASRAQELTKARTCTPDEYLSTADCRVALDGHVVKLTNTEARLAVGGRDLTMTVQIKGDVTHRDGTPVTVTFWRGRPVHMEGPGLRVDAEDAPNKKSVDHRISAVFFLIAPPVLVAMNLFFSWILDRTRA